MASPLQSAQQSVNLQPVARRVSKIRRDPPPVAKKVEERDPDTRDTRTLILGILAFELALLIIFIAIASYNGWSPRHTILRF